MLVVYIIISITIILGYILFAPVNLIVNSFKGDYYIAQPGILKISLAFSEKEIVKLQIRILFIPFRINPFKSSGKKHTSIKPRKKNRKLKNPGKMLINLFRAFKIKRLKADIDTGDFPLNAQLIPLAQTINGQKINLNINFEDRNEADIWISAQIIRIISTLIKHRLRNR